MPTQPESGVPPQAQFPSRLVGSTQFRCQSSPPKPAPSSLAAAAIAQRIPRESGKEAANFPAAIAQENSPLRAAIDSPLDKATRGKTSPPQKARPALQTTPAPALLPAAKTAFQWEVPWERAEPVAAVPRPTPKRTLQEEIPPSRIPPANSNSGPTRSPGGGSRRANKGPQTSRDKPRPQPEPPSTRWDCPPVPTTAVCKYHAECPRRSQ